jgi:hypothetical protein
MTRTILVFCVIAPLVVCIRCGSASNGSRQHNSVGIAAANSFTSISDAGNDLRIAFLKLKRAYPYRQTVTVIDAENGQTLSSETSVIEYASSNRLRLKAQDKNGKHNEMIIFDDFNYLYLNGKWTKEAWSADEKAKMETEHDRFVSSLSEVEFAGPDTVNGVQCKAYTYRWDLDISVSGKFPRGSGKAWIGVAEGLPRQVDQDLPIDNHLTKSHSVYEYKLRFRIARPKF